MQARSICVCICTLKRPVLLEKLLSALDSQRTDNLFTYSAVVVDNDAAESAREAVRTVAARVKYPILYCVEPRKNIALARNRGVLNAKGDLIATIDDDEVPTPEWLFGMFKTLNAYKADGVLGPVNPSYPPHVPAWLIKSGLCNRDSYPTGTDLTLNHPLRTGNTLLEGRIFANGKNLFRADFGITGGEDGAFFAARLDEGYKFVWCDEAPVFEDVPPERSVLTFYLKRLMRSGAMTGKKMRDGEVPFAINFVKSLIVALLLIPAIPIWAVSGKAVFARYFSRYVYHMSRLLGTVGIMLMPGR